MRRLIPALPLAFLLAACGGTEGTPADHAAMGDHAMPAMEEPTPVVSREETAVEIAAPWMRPHPEGRDITAAYFTASLTEGREDLLLSARIDGADRVELHTHTMDAEGVMQMREVGPQRLGEGEPLAFRPGGLHLMVFGLPTVVEGDTVTGTLVFQNAGGIPVSFAVTSTTPAE